MTFTNIVDPPLENSNNSGRSYSQVIILSNYATFVFQKWCCIDLLTRPSPLKHREEKIYTKTYNSRDSLVVTHPTTNRPACGLSTAERTGSPVLHTLWSYVLINSMVGYIAKKLMRAMSDLPIQMDSKFLKCEKWLGYPTNHTASAPSFNCRSCQVSSWP